MQFVALQTRLTVTLDEGGEGTALALMYGEADPGFPDTPTLYYLVSFPGDPRPRLVNQEQIVKQRVA